MVLTTRYHDICFNMEIDGLINVKRMFDAWKMRRIKMKPDGPCKIGLMDPCPWADKRQAQFM